MAQIELVLPVDHGPFVQAKAAELCRPGSGSAEDDPGEGHGLLPVGHKGTAVKGDRRGP